MKMVKKVKKVKMVKMVKMAKRSKRPKWGFWGLGTRCLRGVQENRDFGDPKNGVFGGTCTVGMGKDSKEKKRQFPKSQKSRKSPTRAHLLIRYQNPQKWPFWPFLEVFGTFKKTPKILSLAGKLP
jgi:hypothetical protein